MPLAETIKELVSFILEDVDLLDHTSIFLLRTINLSYTYYRNYAVIDSAQKEYTCMIYKIYTFQ